MTTQEHLRQLVEEYIKTRNDEIKNLIHDYVKANLKASTIIMDESLYNVFVPASGKADTIVGEILRATHNILSNYNDTHTPYFITTSEDTMSAAIYLTHSTNTLINKMIVDTIPINYLAQNQDKTAFENNVLALTNTLGLFIQMNPQLFHTRNTIDSATKYVVEAKQIFQEFVDMLQPMTSL